MCMISKIKLKIHILGNKALFLSIFLSLSLFLSLSSALSLSFVFFLFLRMTYKYGSHNSPLNNTWSHEIYGSSRARADLGVVRVYGPWEGRTKSPKLRVWVSYESMARGVRTKLPKCLGHMNLPSS